MMKMTDETYAKPDVSVDVVPLAISEGRLGVLLAPRAKEPFAGRLALIGGYVHVDEDESCGDAARRVLDLRTGIRNVYVEQLSTFSGPKRDPRGWSISVAYFTISPIAALSTALEAGGCEFVPVEAARGLPFDHDLIVSAAVERLRGKGAYSDIPARFLAPGFPLATLHRVYGIALGGTINYDNFRRKILDRGILEEAGEQAGTADAKRPTTLYRLKPGQAVFDRPL
jgi:8-oxo-dGTP diphosphatase